jgi:hypothetical protein
VLHQLIAGFYSQTLHSPKLLHKLQKSLQSLTNGFQDGKMNNLQLFNLLSVSAQKNTWWFNDRTALP